MFQSVSGEAFKDALARASRTPLFDHALELSISLDDLIDEDSVIHEGDLKIAGSLVAPALCALIIGDLEVSDFVDLRHDGERGLFIVLGSVRCRHFVSDHGCCSIIDGDLVAEQSVVNGFSFSCLTVTGVLRTRLFLGAEALTEVGAGADMEYGVGYCLPMDYCDASKEAIRPRHGEDETVRAVVAVPGANNKPLGAETVAGLIRAGEPLFRLMPI
jgi:hypothetical protein